MPLRIVHRENLGCPVIVCDHCDGEVRRAVEGNYQSICSQDPRRNLSISLTNKQCSGAFEVAHPAPSGARWGSGELRDLPVFIAKNFEMDSQRLSARSIPAAFDQRRR
jgi:hypothetical protein